MIYQLMFAIITPALICGAFAERMKFSAMLLFMALWSLLVYSPMAHMVWGKGGLLNASPWRPFPDARLRRRHRRPRYFRRFGAGLRPVSRQTAWDIPRSQCRPTVWYLALSERVCCGWAGLDSTPAVR